MPHASTSPKVSFEPTPIYSRLPHDDEAYVMRAFAKHASHCPACADPYIIHKKGGTLCQRGHKRAIDVAQYVYNKRGQAYSVVDREGDALVQIEIPAKAEAVRSLLKAMEKGLQVGNVYEPYPRRRAVDVHNSYSSSSSASNSSDEERRHSQRKQRKEKPMPIYTGELYSGERLGKKVYMTRGERAEKDMKERERFYARRAGYYQPHMIYSPAPVAVGGYYYR